MGLAEPPGVDELARLLDLLVATASGIAWADGEVDSAELELAVEIVERSSEYLLSPSEIRKWVSAQYRSVIPPASVSLDLRKVALRCGALIAVADGKLTAAEEEAIHAYAAWLGFARSTSQAIIAEISHLVAGLTLKEEDEIERACRILGVDRNVGPIALKQRYRQLMMEVHPDVIGPSGDVAEASRRAAEINWAYDLLSRYTA
jgi:DnaJ-domain-containing protein 1